MSECIELMVGVAIMFFSIGVLVGEVVGKRKWKGEADETD